MPKYNKSKEEVNEIQKTGKYVREVDDSTSKIVEVYHKLDELSNILQPYSAIEPEADDGGQTGPGSETEMQHSINKLNGEIDNVSNFIDTIISEFRG